jgi:hypothetical protein
MIVWQRLDCSFGHCQQANFYMGQQQQQQQQQRAAMRRSNTTYSLSHIFLCARFVSLLWRRPDEDIKCLSFSRQNRIAQPSVSAAPPPSIDKSALEERAAAATIIFSCRPSS